MDPVDEQVKKKLVSQRSFREESTLVELPNSVKSNEELHAKLEEAFAAIANLQSAVETLKTVKSKMRTTISRLESAVERNSMELKNLRDQVDRLWQNLCTLSIKVDDQVALCSGGDEESKARLRLLEHIRTNENLVEHLEAILTELEALTTVAKAVDSGMMNWRGSMPQVIGYASFVASLISLAPVAGKSVSSIAKGVAVGLKVRPRMKQRLQFEAIAKSMSTLKLTLSSDSLDKLLLGLAMEWSTMHEAEISKLPTWNSELGKEFRKDLQNTWRFICNRVRKGAKKSKKSLLEHVQDACVKLMQQVGLTCTSVLFKRSKPPEAPKKLSIRGALHDLFAKGSLMMFGGENVDVVAMGRKLVGGKPLSPSTVLGKAHAREILQILMDPR